jgi:hypothetical protein
MLYIQSGALVGASLASLIFSLMITAPAPSLG